MSREGLPFVTIYKSCDIRGVYGDELDEAAAFLLGRAIASRLGGAAIVVGGDLRVSTASLKSSLVDGLVASGGEVIDLGLLPTPAFYYGKQRLGAAGGVMVTASHNPASHNGFKIALGELPILPEDLQQLRRDMEAGSFAEARGTVRQDEVLADYMGTLCAAFPKLSHRRVVVDAGNGSMGTVAPSVLRSVGQEVDELYCAPDGTFPNRSPNPSVPEHLSDLIERVRFAGADLGVAYDGDGDRVIFADETGRVQPADSTLVLLVRHMLATNPDAAVVYDLKSSSAVPEAILAGGGRPIRERSGHAFIKRRLLTEGALLGGEVSGHYFFGEIGGDDALFATLFLLRVLDALGQSLAKAIETVPVYPITPDLRLLCPAEHAQRILAEIESAFDGYPVDTLDGVRVEFPRGWALARISVTEPLITLRFEGQTVEDLDGIQGRVREASPDLDRLMARAGV